MIHTPFEILAAFTDHPDRPQINYLSHGNALYSTKYGYACNINELIHILPHNHIPTVCNRCLNWDIMSNNELYKTYHSKDYPVEKLHENKK